MRREMPFHGPTIKRRLIIDALLLVGAFTALATAIVVIAWQVPAFRAFTYSVAGSLGIRL